MANIEELFKNYEIEAFRLETLPQYKVSGEWEKFLLYKEQGIVEQDDDLEKYLADASQKIAEGKRHIRARVIPDPLTDYFVFETKAGYIPQQKLGFELLFLEGKNYNQIMADIFEGEGFNDFWLFDLKYVAKMYYGAEGVFEKIEIIEDDKILEKMLKMRDIFIKQSYSLQNVLDKYNIDA